MPYRSREDKRKYMRDYMRAKRREEEQHPYPAAVDVERALLSALLQAPDRIPEVAAVLEPEQFYLPLHGRIYSTMLEMFGEGEDVDLPLLVARMKQKWPETSATEVTGLVMGGEGVPALIPRYAQEVAEKARLRELMLLCERVLERAARQEAAAEELREELLAAAVGVAKTAAKTLPLRQVIEELMRDVDARWHNQEAFVGLPTGLRELDKLLGGLHRGDLITIGGRTGMGKSSLASHILLAAAKAGKVVVIFSTEVDALRLARRLVSQEALVDTHKFRRPRLMTEKEFMAVVEAERRLAGLKVYVNDHPSPTPGFIRAECLRVRAEAGRVDLVIVDYIGLLAWTEKVENRNLELGKISASLKGLARELDCPVVVLSQLNREVERRQDKRPKLSDLRESGNLEQDSDVVIGLYRPEYYDPTDRPGEVEIIVLKNRDGPTGSVWAAFMKEFTVFRDREVGEGAELSGH